MIKSVYLGIDPGTVKTNFEYIKKHGAISCIAFDDFDKALQYIDENNTELVFIEQHSICLDAMNFIKQARMKGIFTEYIVITADDNPDEISNMYLSGVFEVITKPFDYKMFCAVANNFIEHIQKKEGTTLREPSWIPRCSVFAKSGSDLEKNILKHLDNGEYSATQLSHKCGKSDFVVRQCLNRLVNSGVITSRLDKTGESPVRIYSKNNINT